MRKGLRKIVVEGGSTAYGMHDAEGGGWASRLLRDTLRSTDSHTATPEVVVNRALPGRTLSAVARDMDITLDRDRRSASTTSIVSAGLNEAKVFPRYGRPMFSLEDFAGHMEHITMLANIGRVGLLWVGPQPLAAETVHGITGATLEDDLVEEYGELMRDHANQTGTPYVDTRKLFLEHGVQELMDEDGYHPNPLGHVVLHQAVRSALPLAQDLQGDEYRIRY
jgi:lysophospholipase L1-like esterase